MAILTTPNYGIKYPDKNEPPTISVHLANIATGIDTAMKLYQDKMNADFAKHKTDEETARNTWITTSEAKWASWKLGMDTQLGRIEAALATEGWGTPTTIAGTLFTAATGYTVIAGSRGVKVGNVCAWTYKFQKTADPALVAGANGNLANVVVGTMTAAMPTPTTITPFTILEEGFQAMGYLNTLKQVVLTALAPNVNLPKTYTMAFGGIYLFNPIVP